MSVVVDFSLGATVQARLAELARLTDEPGCLTRLYLSPAHRQAVTLVGDWMAAAGMSVALDAAATLIGRYAGRQASHQTLLLGSHIDTVRSAGRYDGTLGVVAAIEAVASLHRAGERLPFALEVLAFGDEEGVRFPTTLTGSRALAGGFDPVALDGRDGDGISLAEALRAFGGLPDRVTALARPPETVLGYVELHIEQGPVLEAADLPLGIVTAINGATRYRATIVGTPGHAGTVPMGLRRDALAAAAEMVLAVERIARGAKDLVATVGRIEASPGAVNVIPGMVRFTIDLRAPDDSTRAAACAALSAELQALAALRDVELALEQTHDAPAAPCDPRLIGQLEAAVVRAGLRPLRLPSGAGHDGMALARLCPIGMLFVRCRRGLSHHPDEFAATADIDRAVQVLLDFLRRFQPVRAL